MTARSYFYHLEFELFDKAPERSALPQGAAVSVGVWLPPLGTDIFSTNLPEHSKPVELKQKPTKQSHIKSKLQDEEWPEIQHLEFSEKAQTKTRRPVIDCGATRRSETSQNSLRGEYYKSTQIPKPGSQRAVNQAAEDWRFERVRVESVQFEGSSANHHETMDGPSDSRPNTGNGSTPTRGLIEPLKIKGTKNTELGWGIVHLYREGEETPSLRDLSSQSIGPSTSSTNCDLIGEMEHWDTTILCIPAVPSYMTASDFLGWVGEKTRSLVSHFRMVMTGRMNRYMMLMKFRDGRDARRWRAEWDGKVFNGMEPENCHVLFIKSIRFQTTESAGSGKRSFPDMSCDLFTPTLTTVGDSPSTSFATKPLPPPTPALVELPTCPVCLERMDETTGLLTILCQHIFHCDCLQKWRGSGCPVCRHIQPTTSTNLPFGITIPNRDINLCHTCDCADDLWICLICGSVGCGRYKGGHAKEHWKETAHPFALEIETQHVWDYAEDLWVHRLIQTKGDGKVAEQSQALGSFSNGVRPQMLGQIPDDMELIPRNKLENMGMEYTQMLTSQLESQRIYFEEQVAKTVDKAARSAKAAEEAMEKAQEAMKQLKEISIEHRKMRDEIIPGLERDRDRMASRAEKSHELARSMTKSFQEEKQVSKGLMDRIKHLEDALERVRKEVIVLKEENTDLKEQNRDLSFFISSQDKLKNVDSELAEEIREGTMSVPEAPQPKAGKGKKKKGKGKTAE